MATASSLGNAAGSVMATLLDKVLSAARSYIGQHETTGNSGFVDKAFQKKMEAIGWNKGQSWCAYFAELAWKQGFEGHPLLPALDKLFSPSATATYSNFYGSTLFKTGLVPKPGALVAWRHGNGWQGHMGIVESVSADKIFVSIEGNTNQAGGREGVAVLRKTRQTGQPFKPSGLNLLGFVYLPT